MDRRVDLYALGVVLYRMLTGRYPFEGSSATELLSAHLHGKVPRFSDVAPDLLVPDGCEHVVRRLLAKRPVDRYTNADQVLAQLTPLLDVPSTEFVSGTLHDVSNLEPPPELVREPPVQPAPSRLWAIGAVLVLLLALVGASALGGLTVYWLLEQRTGPAPVVVDPMPTPEPPVAQPVPQPAAPQPEAPQPVAQPDPRPQPPPRPAPEPATGAIEMSR